MAAATYEAGNRDLHRLCRLPVISALLMGAKRGPSVDWLMVQPEVAKFSRLCSSDRPGYGWSDSGPAPRGSLQIAHELKQLLQACGEIGPYVLVGHSMGGYDIRL
jgi:pimeloyl-ACP methyl ester carboxylesterase